MNPPGASVIVIAFLLVLVAAGYFLGRATAPPISSLTERLVDIHLARPELAQWRGVIESAKKEVTANFQQSVDKFLAVAGDVVRVDVGETMDTHEPTIQLTDSKGNHATLWLKKDGSIGAISGY